MMTYFSLAVHLFIGMAIAQDVNFACLPPAEINGSKAPRFWVKTNGWAKDDERGCFLPVREAHNATLPRVTPCTAWVYEMPTFNNNIIQEWDLVCSRQRVRPLLQVIFFAGGLVVWVLPFLVDWAGRRPVILTSVVASAACSLSAYFVESLLFFALFRFALGSCLAVTFVTSSVLCEHMFRVSFSDSKWRFTQAAVPSLLEQHSRVCTLCVVRSSFRILLRPALRGSDGPTPALLEGRPALLLAACLRVRHRLPGCEGVPAVVSGPWNVRGGRGRDDACGPCQRHQPLPLHGPLEERPERDRKEGDLEYKVLMVLGLWTSAVCHAVLPVQNVELFPQLVRTFGFCWGEASALLGALCSPYVAMEALESGPWAALVLIGGLAVLSACLTVTLPETRRPAPVTRNKRPSLFDVPAPS
ncbi:hypothetical protein V5799_017726 [Amblyomma americanum]|uniref:Uncharacterized protein n=1 Tax=Amblyomma americanum TaxID=6943 RepID=A0AAQ4F2E3_AMBAM